MYTTPVSLLERLGEPSRAEAWTRFVELYTPLFHYWARRLEPNDNDANDLVQDVFAVLVAELPEFRHRGDKRFRGWLWTVMLNRSRRLRRHRHSAPAKLSQDEVELAATPDDTTELDEEEYRSYVINRCLRLMQTDFQPAVWQACWSHVVEGRPAAEIAAELGMTVNAVYLAKSRVLRRLREELRGLLD